MGGEGDGMEWGGSEDGDEIGMGRGKGIGMGWGGSGDGEGRGWDGG